MDMKIGTQNEWVSNPEEPKIRTTKIRTTKIRTIPKDSVMENPTTKRRRFFQDFVRLFRVPGNYSDNIPDSYPCPGPELIIS